MCNKEKFWGVLAEELGHPEWATDPRLDSFKARLANRELVTELLDRELSKHPTGYWLDRMRGKVPVSPVNDIRQALENPFVHERRGVRDYVYPDGRVVQMIASPIRCPGVDLPNRAASAMGADSDALLTELGYDRARIDALRQTGVLG